MRTLYSIILCLSFSPVIAQHSQNHTYKTDIKKAERFNVNAGQTTIQQANDVDIYGNARIEKAEHVYTSETSIPDSLNMDYSFVNGADSIQELVVWPRFGKWDGFYV